MTCHQIPGVGIACSGRGRSFRCQVVGRGVVYDVTKAELAARRAERRRGR